MTFQWNTDGDGFVHVNGIILMPAPVWSARMDDDVLDRWGDLAARIAKEEGVPWHWIMGIMAAESWGDPNAGSHAGAKGLMQIMPFNFPLYWGKSLSNDQMLDPEINVRTGAKMLRRMRDHGMDLPAAASAYNAGPKTSPPNGTWTAKRCSDGYPCTNRDWDLYAESDYITKVVSGANYARSRQGNFGGGAAKFALATAALGLAYWMYKR